MDNVCSGCRRHAWWDEMGHHVCTERDIDEQPFNDTCPKWAEKLRGKDNNQEEGLT